MFAGGVGASHYMLIYRMKLMSALQCRLVLCFVVLEGGMIFGIGLPVALYGGLVLLVRVFGFVVVDGVVWGLRGRRHWGGARLGLYCRRDFCFGALFGYLP